MQSSLLGQKDQIAFGDLKDVQSSDRLESSTLNQNQYVMLCLFSVWGRWSDRVNLNLEGERLTGSPSEAMVTVLPGTSVQARAALCLERICFNVGAYQSELYKMSMFSLGDREE